MLSNTKLSPVARVLPHGFENIFKENYVLGFLNLPEQHSETDLQKGLIKQMKFFLRSSRLIKICMKKFDAKAKKTESSD